MGSRDVDMALSLAAPEAAQQLLKLPEDQWFDRKSGRVAAKDVAKILVAMANAEGGVVAVGLSAGKIDGVRPEKRNDIRQAALDYTVPPVRVDVQELETSAGMVMVLVVAPGDCVHETSSGDCYLRVGDESRKLRYQERRELEYDRGSIPFDGTPSPEPELSASRVEQFQKLLGSSSPQRALRARNLLTSRGAPNVAAYLLFSDHPQEVYPNAYIRVLKYVGENRGEGVTQMLESGVDFRCEGPLPEQIETASQRISKLMPHRRVLGADGKFTDVPMIPQGAWLEGVVNAVTHRSYSISGDHIRVEIFSNRLEITSPGRFPGVADLAQPLQIHRHARNPRIARVLADLQYTQELGEGIRRIVLEMRRLGLADPIYAQSQNQVLLTLMATDALPLEVRKNLPQSSQQILDALRIAGCALGTGEIADLTGLARPTVLRHLRALEAAKIVTWQGNTVKDPRASWSLS